jgi:hypothetical protein
VERLLHSEERLIDYACEGISFASRDIIKRTIGVRIFLSVGPVCVRGGGGVYGMDDLYLEWSVILFCRFLSRSCSVPCWYVPV